LLGVFAKIPDREPAKTRLQARLSREQAARFQWASLADTLETAARVVPEPWLFLAHGSDERPQIGAALVAHGLDAETWRRVALYPQHGDDLGARMTRALDAMRARGPGSDTLLIGSDSPSLPASLLHAAFAAFADADVVLGPAADGGYWCVGVGAGIATAGLFEGVTWSRSDTLAATQAQAARLGHRVTLAEPWFDVDRPEDLDLLAQQLEALRRAGDDATGRHVERWLRSEGWLRHDAASEEAER